MSIEHVNPATLGKPSGFSHAVRASGGTTVHLAGQTALDANGQILGDNIIQQFEKALTNMLTALQAAAGSPRDLVSLTIYLVDIKDYRAHGREIGRVWKRLIGDSYPATAAIGVTRLWDVEALVEVQGVAYIPG